MTIAAGVASPDGVPYDTITVAGIAGYGHHGVLDSERATGQRFTVDVVLSVSTRAAAEGDDLGATVDYGLVADDVHKVITGEPFQLIETVAERIADACLVRAGVFAVTVTVHKPGAPIAVPFDDVSVTITRRRR